MPNYSSIKPKTTKTCKNEGCNNTFRPYKSTDKYCSYSCFYSDKENKAKYKIKQTSDKMKKELKLYKELRSSYLNLKENKFCPVCLLAFEGKININELSNSNEILYLNGYIRATEIHHKAGRVGKLLNYTPHWLAVSRSGHKWIHDNPLKSYNLGLLIKSTTV